MLICLLGNFWCTLKSEDPYSKLVVVNPRNSWLGFRKTKKRMIVCLKLNVYPYILLWVDSFYSFYFHLGLSNSIFKTISITTTTYSVIQSLCLWFTPFSMYRYAADDDHSKTWIWSRSLYCSKVFSGSQQLMIKWLLMIKWSFSITNNTFLQGLVFCMHLQSFSAFVVAIINLNVLDLP